MIVHKGDCHLVAIEGQSNPKRFSSRNQASQFLQQSMARLLSCGYWYASMDTLSSDTCLKVSVFKGPLIKSVSVIESGENGAKTSTLLKPAAALKLPELKIENLANAGFPFAKSSFTKGRFDTLTGLLNLELEVVKGPKMTWDTISLQPKGLIAKSVLSSYLQISKGGLFKESVWKQVEPKLRNLEFAKPILVRPLFHDREVLPIIELSPVKTNEAEGMLGFLPQDGGRPGLTLMGQLKASINNLFGQGHKLQFQWQRIRPLTQTLDFQYKTLTFAKLPIGLQTGVFIFRSDTAFLQVGLKAGLIFYNGANFKWTIGLERQSTQLITNSLDYARSLGIGSRNAIGLNTQVSYRSVNESVSPRTGFYFTGEASIFQRQILASVADSMPITNNQIRVRVLAGYWLPLMGENRRLLGFKYQGGLITGTNLARNEQFFLGGFRSLRGFNENNFAARSFSLSTVDLRFYSLEGSFLSIFSDYGFLQVSTQNQANNLFALAAGFGFGLKLQGGLLQIQVAAGSTSGVRGLELDAARLHLGYYAQF